MLTSLALVGLTLRAGLAIRRARLARQRPPKDARARHLRLARPAVAFVLVGLVAGVTSAVWLRGWEAFASFHGLLGGIAAVLFTLAAWQGHALEHGARDARSAHALLGALATLFAAVAAIAGFVLLP